MRSFTSWAHLRSQEGIGQAVGAPITITRCGVFDRLAGVGFEFPGAVGREVHRRAGPPVVAVAQGDGVNILRVLAGGKNGDFIGLRTAVGEIPA